MILIVDMNWKKDSLAFNEFVLPIVSILQSFEQCEVKHFLDLDITKIGTFSRVVLSGTALKDQATLEQIEKFCWIKDLNKPILGICAGMQTISLVFDCHLVSCSDVGMIEIVTLQKNILCQDTFKAYALHNYSVGQCDNFKVLAKSANCIQAIKHIQKNIYGLLFHPEVRNQEILKRFININ